MSHSLQWKEIKEDKTARSLSKQVLHSSDPPQLDTETTSMSKSTHQISGGNLG